MYVRKRKALKKWELEELPAQKRVRKLHTVMP